MTNRILFSKVLVRMDFACQMLVCIRSSEQIYILCMSSFLVTSSMLVCWISIISTWIIVNSIHKLLSTFLVTVIIIIIEKGVSSLELFNVMNPTSYFSPVIVFQQSRSSPTVNGWIVLMLTSFLTNLQIRVPISTFLLRSSGLVWFQLVQQMQ